MKQEDSYSFDDFSLFLSALKFSAEKHRNQRRKDAEKTPYLNHPVQVTELLWRVGGIRDISVLTAAILHDIIEDTETAPSEIRNLFGEEVLSLVLEVSDDKALPKATRKELQVAHAPGLSRGAKLIKIADKICNIRDVTFSPPHNWPLQRRIEYLDWAERVVRAMGPFNPALEECFFQLLAECRRNLGEQPVSKVPLQSKTISTTKGTKKSKSLRPNTESCPTGEIVSVPVHIAHEG